MQNCVTTGGVHLLFNLTAVVVVLITEAEAMSSDDCTDGSTVLIHVYSPTLATFSAEILYMSVKEPSLLFKFTLEIVLVTTTTPFLR